MPTPVPASAMVMLESTFIQQQAARRLVRALGVPDKVLEATHAANAGVDWEALVHALDGVFLNHGGSMGQVSFLRARHRVLGGQTPIEALAGVGGPEQVCHAAQAFARAGQS